MSMATCQGGCGALPTQRVVKSTEELSVCGYCAVSLVESGYRIASWR